MLLINQDRNCTYEYNGQTLYTAPVFAQSGVLLGFNLYMQDVPDLLGTFDTSKEAIAEMHAISNTDCPVWYVSGYSNYGMWDDWNILCRIIGKESLNDVLD